MSRFMHYDVLLLHMLRLLSLVSLCLLLLVREQRSSNQVCRTSQLDAYDPLNLAQQLLVGDSFSRFDIGDLSSAHFFAGVEDSLHPLAER
jgi:hypothetical protein